MMLTKLQHVVCRRSHSPIRGLARLAPTGTNAAARGGKIETRTRDFITAAAAIVVVVDVFASKLEHCEFRRFWIFVPLLVVVTTLRMNWTGSSETERRCLSVRPSALPRWRGGAQSLLLFFSSSSSLPRLVPQVTHCYSLQVACRSNNTQICDSSLMMCQSRKMS